MDDSRPPSSSDSPPDAGRRPLCPGCGEPRTTTCPYCETSSGRFPLADDNFFDGLQPLTLGGVPAEAPRTSQKPDTIVVCSTCDEPFRAEFLRRCEWCGHRFPDGREQPEPLPLNGAETMEESQRVLLVAVVLGALAVAVLAYMLLVLRPS